MPFIDNILKYRSVAVIGLEKNCGKTECLNYILRRISPQERKICVTSIGLDGESLDQVTETRKPEIILKKDMLFSTSEQHYRQRRLVSEVMDISNESSALGRIITARVVTEGKIILSGPSSTVSLKRWMNGNERLGVGLTIVDGALSRRSSASPAITDAMILATGAALSSNLPNLVIQSAFAVEMIKLPLLDADFEETEENTVCYSSMTGFQDISEGCRRVRISGALTDMFLKRIASSKKADGLEVVVKDFTRIFAKIGTYRAFTSAGGKLRVEKQSKLLAVCVNPLAPNGYKMNSDELCDKLSEKIGLPVYDIVKNNYEA